MTTLDILTNKVAALKQARQQISINRDQWSTVVRPFLLAQLTQIKETFPIGWSVAPGNSGFTNLDNVSLSFDNTDSGIVEVQTGQPVSKQGGGLFFGQLYNGSVVVLIVYPAVPNFAQASPPLQVGTYLPSEIDATFVTRTLVQFLDEMTNWEAAGEHPTDHIGF